MGAYGLLINNEMVHLTMFMVLAFFKYNYRFAFHDEEILKITALEDYHLRCFDSLENCCERLMWVHLGLGVALIVTKLNENFEEMYKNKEEIEQKQQQRVEKQVSLQGVQKMVFKEMINSTKENEDDSKVGSYVKGVINWVFDHQDHQWIPVSCLFLQIFFLLISISDVQQCKTDYVQGMLMVKWMMLEGCLFICNFLGIVVFMFVRSVLSRFNKRMNFSILTERTAKLTDALSRNYFNASILQWALNNFLVSTYVFFQRDSSLDLRRESQQFRPILINILAGACQTLSILQLFGLQLIPIKRSKKNTVF